MNITEVKVHPVEQEKLKAYVSIILDDCFLVSDIKIISGPSGLFVSMPSKRKKTGEFKDVAHPLNRETRQWMEQRILGEYDRSIRLQPETAENPSPSPEAEAEATPASTK